MHMHYSDFLKMFWINKESTNISLDKLLFPHWYNTIGVKGTLIYIT